MKRTFSDEFLKELDEKFDDSFSAFSAIEQKRSPVHVVYGGADRFSADTPRKFGKIALKSIETYAPDFVEFARAMWLTGADALPQFSDVARGLENRLKKNAEAVREENYAAWLAWTVYRKTVEKLETEPVEDFRIDFEDGYGIRSDEEEDRHAISASDELAKAFLKSREPQKNQKSAIRNPQSAIPRFCGFRIKSFAPETRKRAVRTLDLFLTNFLEKTEGELPENFVVTLPKITSKKEIKVLCELLGEIEKQNCLPEKSIGVEIMIETPQAIVDEKGKIALRGFVKAGRGRVASAHFGAYDYTASFGISGAHQHLRHEACNFARQMMQISLAPLCIRLSDSVTTEMPIPVHKGENLSAEQIAENKRTVHAAWRKHFNNVTNSQINGFYQSWDLHPAQLPARYAAVYAFFLESKDEQAQRLKNFVEKATRAATTGNQFDDAASAQGLLNFFIRALDCGALSEGEISEATALTAKELRSASFLKIMETRGGGKRNED